MTELEARLQAVRNAWRGLRSLPAETKNRVLSLAALGLVARQTEILAANVQDVGALPAGTDSAFLDRLVLNSERIALMAESLRQVEALADPVGETIENKTLDNGLRIRR